jgi:hypothetical protein
MRQDNRTYKDRRSIYTALEDLDFLLDLKEVEEIDFLWSEGRSIVDISKYYKRNQNEVFVLLLDRAIKGRIDGRSGGIFGHDLQ